MPTSVVALAILLLAIAPGYVAVSVWSRARTWKGPSGELRTVLQALVLSAVVQAVTLPLTAAWILPIRRHWQDFPARLGLWSVATVIVVPLIIGVGAARLYDFVFAINKERNTGWHAILDKAVGPAIGPSVWDTVFDSQRVPPSAFLVVEFRDGRRLAGAFARHSIAQTSPEPHGLYLEREWALTEDGFVSYEIPGTGGLLILATDDVRAVHILAASEAPAVPPPAQARPVNRNERRVGDAKTTK